MSADRSLKRIVINNFLGGIAWALGVSVGASLILAVLGFILGKINLIPAVGIFVIRVNQFIAENSHVLTK